MTHLNKTDLEELEKKSRWIWEQTLRIHQRAPETRVASSLSCVDLFTVLYYGNILQYKADEPLWSGRDRLIISKGHGSICMYPLLADLGYFEMEELQHVCQEGSFLGGIPDPVIPGYETVNGSLGHGLGVGAGIALALKRQGSKQRVFVVVGDGELHEGSNWEAIMFAAQHNLNNLILVVDNNKICMLGHTATINNHEPLTERFSAFGWEACEVDGHSIENLYETITETVKMDSNKPRVIVANTLKGKGVPSLEDVPLSHILSVKPELIDELIEG